VGVVACRIVAQCETPTLEVDYTILLFLSKIFTKFCGGFVGVHKKSLMSSEAFILLSGLKRGCKALLFSRASCFCFRYSFPVLWPIYNIVTFREPEISLK
jgi:hypothetical protein